ncbi:MAG: hypothetical protein ABI743_08690, partial [bacterium]
KPYDTTRNFAVYPARFWFVSSDVERVYLGNLDDHERFQIPMARQESGFLWVQLQDGSVVSRQF